MAQFIHPNNVIPDKQYHLNSVLVNEYLVKNHNFNNLQFPAKRIYPLKGVTIHNTSTLGQDDDGKWYTASTLNNNMNGVFVHYYVSCVGAWKNLDDDYMNWSCSDGIAYAGGNAATIALEIIMNGQNGVENKAAMDYGAKIAAYILYKNGLTANDLYTHSYWINTKIFGMNGTKDYLNTAKNTRKNCPVYIIPQWDSFKRLVDEYVVKLGGKTVYEKVSEKVSASNIIYKSVSNAAVRAGMSKDATIYTRVVKRLYYPADKVYDNWFKHAGQNAYSMLVDGGKLFEKAGEYTIKKTTAKLNIRAEPDLKGAKIAVLDKNTPVYVMAEPAVKSGGYSWVKVIVGNKICYAVEDYLNG